MRVVLQRVKHASVSVDNKLINKIANGYLLLVAFKYDDTLDNCRLMAKKIANLRVFEDSEGKLNCDLKSVNGAILSISQFTLYGDTKKGNRPSFVLSAKSDVARPLYDAFNDMLKEYDIDVYGGAFGEHMEIDLCNDGPVTIILEN